MSNLMGGIGFGVLIWATLTYLPVAAAVGIIGAVVALFFIDLKEDIVRLRR